MADTVAQTVVLAVVDEIVVDVIALASGQGNARVPKGRDFAIVYLDVGIFAYDAVRCGKLVVVFVSVAPGPKGALWCSR